MLVFLYCKGPEFLKKKMNRKWANLGLRVKKKIKATMKKGVVVGEVKV